MADRIGRNVSSIALAEPQLRPSYAEELVERKIGHPAATTGTRSFAFLRYCFHILPTESWVQWLIA